MLKYQISWKSFQWGPGYYMRMDGQKDGHTNRREEADSCISKFCERTSKWIYVKD